MKNKTLIIVLGVLVVCCCVCVAAFGALVYSGSLSLAPYSFSEEEMTSAYLKDQKELAGFKQVTLADYGLGEEYTSPFGDNSSYYTKDGKVDMLDENSEVIGVMVGDDADEFSSAIKEAEKEYSGTDREKEKEKCDPYEEKSGSINKVEYQKGVCGKIALYAYNDGDRYIIFMTTAGKDVLEQAIEDYQK